MILDQLQKIWSQSNAWPGFIQAMRVITPGYNQKKSSNNRLLAMWSDFPGVICSAAGGKPGWVENLSLAWMVFYGAAAIMDSIEDGDQPESEWSHLTPGMAVNAASGLFFSASLALNRLFQEEATRYVAGEVIDQFYRGYLTMCGGQQQDLITPRPSLKEYWEIASGKSGVFFGTICKCSARFGTDDSQRLQGFYDFGSGIGLLIQMLDDIEDVQKFPYQGRWKDLFHCLPVIFALESGQPDQRKKLEELLQSETKDPKEAEEFLDLIDITGAARYFISEFTNRRKLALEGLESARPKASFDKKLAAYLPELKFNARN
jgi:geranylgeranyl pyrophosphate synthase